MADKLTISYGDWKPGKVKLKRLPTTKIVFTQNKKPALPKDWRGRIING